MDKESKLVFYHFNHKTLFYLITEDNTIIKKIVKVTKAKSWYALYGYRK